MKRGIFLKILIFLIVTGTGPVILFYFLTIQNYQEIIMKIAPYLSSETLNEIKNLYENIRIQLWLTLLLTLILIIFFGLFWARSITNPIQKLIRGVEEIAKGKLDIKVNVKTNDEIETLADAFNKMASELKTKTEALEEEKASLEIKVRARTEALLEERALLEEKVKERTKELREKIEELEKFHKLAVGRELKMIELKEEIKKLKEELAKEKRV